jgi:hypothetical protein
MKLALQHIIIIDRHTNVTPTFGKADSKSNMHCQYSGITG